ncbi:MAG: DNA methyltransferase [Pirellulales bacterium]
MFLPRFLADEGEKVFLRGERQNHAFEVIKRWAQLDKDGHLKDRKETSLDADFLREIFGDALGYRNATDSPDAYELERSFTVPGIGTADGALGAFRAGESISPQVIIELKGAAKDLDRDRISGRTPVQQCWDYLNGLPECPWGIVSNFSTIRLYHRDKTPLAYEEFQLQELEDLKAFRQFFAVFEIGGLVRPTVGFDLRAKSLLARTENRQRTVGDELYEAYSKNRYDLILHLKQKHGKNLDTAVHIAQKLLDRIIFVAFCEDRDLLPEKCIDRAYRTLPPFTKVTNPRWRNFLDLFQAIDVGHETFLQLKTGYNGGLFRRDAEVDDLQLEDRWTDFFRGVGNYDFRDEVNVDVLGHIFEKSVSEIERIRVGGLFEDSGGDDGTSPAMRKSAERKRFGIYYTPPDFTEFIVRETVLAIIDQREGELLAHHKLSAEALKIEKRSAKHAAFWREFVAALRTITACDPACGSGAFLMPAYGAFEERYEKAVAQLAFHGDASAKELAAEVPDIILRENLFGVDLNEQAVEITQLALWIRSARRDKSLADLSKNIVCGNSLVSDDAVDARAMNWQQVFPQVFGRAERPGFDCVIGNPPWERLKLQEREFFAFSAPQIGGAVSAAKRRELIGDLDTRNPELFERYTRAKADADRSLTFARTSGEFPLTGKGDINTYALFAELARKIVAPQGRVGLLVPSGIATDDTTKEFFAELMESESLIRFHDFENRRRIFPDVDGRFKFCTLVFGGSATKNAVAAFTFFLHSMDDLADKKRHIELTGKDLALLNPNTRTCPVFRSPADAKLTKAIYRRVPILVDLTRKKGGNPWGIKFVRMFDQTNDAELFHDAQQLKSLGAKCDGNRWKKGKRTFLPLYEAKMVQAFDHRAASVVVAEGNWVRQGQTEATSLVSHQNPEFVAQPRWWVESSAVDKTLGKHVKDWFLAYKDVTSATNQRTMIASFIPRCGVVNSAPLVLLGDDISPRQECCLLANLNSFAFDFVARQKVGGVHLNFFIVNQLPAFPPDFYEDKCPWKKRESLASWISERVLKLSCTADDMRPLAEAAGFKPGAHKWKPADRAEIIAELDAAYFLLYEIERGDVQYILSTFSGVDDAGDAGLFAKDASVLAAYDRLAKA